MSLRNSWQPTFQHREFLVATPY